MKWLPFSSVLLLTFSIASITFAWSGQWGNVSPFGGGPPEQCPPIQPGSLIQLIHAGDNWQQDDPIEWINAQPNPQQAMNNWLAAGCPPVGDDTLRNKTVFANHGPGYEGYFGKPITGTDDECGDPWYTRFFTAPEGLIERGDWYGEVGDRDDPNDPIYELVCQGWDGGPVIFGDYTIRIDGVCADQEIKCIPEPATILITGLALLVGFFRKKRGQIMKRLLFTSVLLLTFSIASTAFGWTGQWGNVSPFGGGPPTQCPPIAPGNLIQLIHAGPNGMIDDPMHWIGSQPNPGAALAAWLSAGTPPVGDDTLRDQNIFANYGPGYEGYFGKPIEGTDDEQGDPWYTRYFTAAQYEVTTCDWYGEVGDRDDPNDPIYELVLTGWDGEKYQFGDYTIRIEGECADKHIVPEPATILIAGFALLIGLSRKKWSKS